MPKRGSLKIHRKAAGKRHFPATQLFQCCAAVFSLAAARLLLKTTSALQKFKANVAVQLLQRSVPKTAAQLPFSLVARRRGGV